MSKVVLELIGGSATDSLEDAAKAVLDSPALCTSLQGLDETKISCLMEEESVASTQAAIGALQALFHSLAALRVGRLQ